MSERNCRYWNRLLKFQRDRKPFWGNERELSLSRKSCSRRRLRRRRVIPRRESAQGPLVYIAGQFRAMPRRAGRSGNFRRQVDRYSRTSSFALEGGPAPLIADIVS